MCAAMLQLNAVLTLSCRAEKSQRDLGSTYRHLFAENDPIEISTTMVSLHDRDHVAIIV